MLKSRKWKTILSLSLGLLLVYFSIGYAKSEKAGLSVAAAANLTKSFTEMGKAFTKQSGIPVTFVFGATGQLTQQIKNGAPVDLFAAADVKSIKGLAEEKIIDGNTIKNYAQGNIVLVPSKNAKFQAKYLSDLKNPKIKIVAIANPETAPYGKAAKEALMAAGIWEKIKDKVVFGKNIDETLTYVKTGNADAAIVAKSLVYETDQKYYENKYWPQLYTPIIQAMGVIENSKNKEAALKFSQFITSPEGKRIILKYGYSIPE